MVVRLNTCCARYDLRKGCVIIGAVWLAFSLLVIVGAPLFMLKCEQEMDSVYQQFSDKWSPEMRQMFDITQAVLRATFYGITILAVADAVCSTMLICGARQGNPDRLLPWVLEQAVLLPIWALLALAFAALNYQAHELTTVVATVFTLLLRTGGTVYFILVVYSLYKYLKGEQVPTNPNRSV